MIILFYAVFIISFIYILEGPVVAEVIMKSVKDILELIEVTVKEELWIRIEAENVKEILKFIVQLVISFFVVYFSLK